MAERLVDTEEGRKLADKLGGIDPDVVETAALIHDLGHPPYGHAVEKELNRLVMRAGIKDGYEGNAQSFRIVTKLSLREPRFVGLNLTRASLNASLKYPWLRTTAEVNYKKSKKWGVYSTEAEIFDWVRKEHRGQIDEASIEAQIMDWADDVAYAVHDVDDFYRAGLVPLDRFRIEDDKQFYDFSQYASENLTAQYARDNIDIRVDQDIVGEVLRDIIGWTPIDSPYIGTQKQRQHLRIFTSSLIHRYVTRPRLAQDPSQRDLLQIPDDLRLEVDILKQLTWFYVIDNRALKTQQYGQRRVVKELFRIYRSAANSSERDLRGILPDSQQEQLQTAVGNSEECIRVVADLISSMTERQLMITHRKLTGIELGSITDLV